MESFRLLSEKNLNFNNRHAAKPINYHAEILADKNHAKLIATFKAYAENRCCNGCQWAYWECGL